MPNLLNSFGRTKTYVNNAGYVILNLTGNQKFVDDTVFYPGKYKIEVQAGASKSSSTVNDGFSGKIETEVNVLEEFVIRAYCGSRASSTSSAGSNPYVGAYKANSNINYGSNVSTVYHMFGNAGSCCRLQTGNTEYYPGGGNCLGDGIVSILYNGSCATGAGSCLHLMPINGVFGRDYLFAFHTTPAAAGALIVMPDGTSVLFGGSGSAYGGAGSGSSNDVTIPSQSYNGGSTPYGTGGAGVSGGTETGRSNRGKNGTGIGHGFGGGIIAKGCYTPGAAAYFDGTQWVESDLVGAANEDGKIKITYLGPIE